MLNADTRTHTPVEVSMNFCLLISSLSCPPCHPHLLPQQCSQKAVPITQAEKASFQAYRGDTSAIASLQDELAGYFRKLVHLRASPGDVKLDCFFNVIQWGASIRSPFALHIDHIIPLPADGSSTTLFWYANQLRGNTLLEDVTKEKKVELGCGVQAETVVLLFFELARLPPGRQQEWIEQLRQPTPKPFDNAKLTKQAFKGGLTDTYVRGMVDVTDDWQEA